MLIGLIGIIIIVGILYKYQLLNCFNKKNKSISNTTSNEAFTLGINNDDVYRLNHFEQLGKNIQSNYANVSNINYNNLNIRHNVKDNDYHNIKSNDFYINNDYDIKSNNSYTNNNYNIKNNESYIKNNINDINNSINNTVNNPKELTSIPNELHSLRDQTINIMTGKYKLNKEAVSFLTEHINNFINNLQYYKTINQINTEYNPIWSHDILLEASRILLKYNNLDYNIKILIAQYIINKTKSGNELTQMYNWIITLARNTNIAYNIRAEAADMLLLSNNTKYIKIANNILQELREEQDPLELPTLNTRNIRNIPHYPVNNNLHTLHTLHALHTENIPLGINREEFIQQANLLNRYERNKPKINRSVYEDGQNVHNTEINNSVLESARNLVLNYKPSLNINFDDKLLDNIDHNIKARINSSLHRINSDSSTFKYNLSLYSVFQGLLGYIEQHQHKEELYKRLLEELTDMQSTCATGHLSRMMNVIQGFNTPENTTGVNEINKNDGSKNTIVKISIDDEIYANLKNIAEKEIIKQDNADEIMDDMTSTSKNTFRSFAKKIFDNERSRLINEYKNVANEDIVNKSIDKALAMYIS